MAKKRKAKAVAVVERVDRGTEETRGKLTLDAVSAMVAGGRADGLALVAAGAILRSWSRLYSQPWWSLARYAERVDKGAVTDAARAKAIDEDQTYRRWTDRAPQQRRCGVHAALALDLVHDAVVEQRGVRQIANARRMDQRTVERYLVECLTDYCIVAGWVAPHAVAA
jgi:hypothetical protein